jgi:hypothetical protein
VSYTWRTSHLGNHDANDATEKLPGHFIVWLASDEAAFLRNKYIWVNWDAEELISKAQHIQESKDLEVHLGGVPM